MATHHNVALVIGVTGVTGTPLAEQLVLSGWRVYGISRRRPRLDLDTGAAFVHVAVDLADPSAVGQALSALNDVTHVFYCGNDREPQARTRMLGNVLDAVERAAPGLANVHLLQGTKYYGCHLGPFKVPALETDPRLPGSDFYYAEEDLVRERQRGRRWTWTATRPHAVCGYAAGNPLNLAVVLGVYGSLCKALGQPFVFPGTPACFETRFNVADADLLARGSIWCATTSACGNEAFNLNNGDVFRWCDLWPRLAQFFELPPADPKAPRLPEFLAAHQSIWDRLVARHGLAPFPYERAARWAQGDFSPPNSRFACEYDVVSDLSKIRRYGFDEQVDSGEMFVRLFARYRRERVIP